MSKPKDDSGPMKLSRRRAALQPRASQHELDSDGKWLGALILFAMGFWTAIGAALLWWALS